MPVILYEKPEYLVEQTNPLFCRWMVQKTTASRAWVAFADYRMIIPQVSKAGRSYSVTCILCLTELIMHATMNANNGKKEGTGTFVHPSFAAQTSFEILHSTKSEPICENPRYLSEQIITYLGNKRSLLGFIGNAVETVKHRLGKPKLRIGDMFSGSGIVARSLKQHAEFLLVNDLEDYSYTANKCYLSNRSAIDENDLRMHYVGLLHQLDTGLGSGFITELYAPKDDQCIVEGERVFYTSRNARYIDTCRQLIMSLPNDIQPFFLAPLLSEASIKSNTSGVFKGFYKNSSSSIGQFGGNKRDALSRITTNIELGYPVFSEYECAYSVYREDANELARKIDYLDLVYLDPPYNQHPYGSNYFMLNLINNYKRPEKISTVSGIPLDWNRSAYNKKALARNTLESLVHQLPAHYILISYNSEGFISPVEMKLILESLGKVEVLETKYNAFRGSRNLSGRSTYTKEFLFLVKKGDTI